MTTKRVIGSIMFIFLLLGITTSILVVLGDWRLGLLPAGIVVFIGYIILASYLIS